MDDVKPDDKAEETSDIDALPDESTEGIFNAPSGHDATEWRRHVELAFTLKRMNRLKHSLERIVSTFTNSCYMIGD